ncbi:hypothetical protein N9878_01795, partial [bacterium]|nr:hypothetical protein [bacterium]
MADYTVITGGGGDFTSLSACLLDSVVKAETGVVNVTCSGGQDTTVISSSVSMACSELNITGEGASPSSYNTGIYHLSASVWMWSSGVPVINWFDMQIDDNGSSTQFQTLISHSSGAGNATNCRFLSTDTTQSGEINFIMAHSGKLTNCIVSGVRGDNSGDNKRAIRNNSSFVVSNCLVYDCNMGYYPNSNSTMTLVNSVAFGNKNDLRQTTVYIAGSDNNAIDDSAVADMTGTVNPANWALIYDDAASGDFTLLSTGTDLIDGGVNASALNGGVTADMEGTAWGTEWGIGVSKFITAFSLSGPSSTTEGAETEAAGTGLDTATAFKLITAPVGFSVTQTIDSQTATTLNYSADSGVNDCAPGVPVSGVPLAPTVSAVGVTPYVVAQEADDGTTKATLSITLNGEATHDTVQVMIATSNTTIGVSVLATNIIAVEDDMQYYAPKAANGMNITWNADGTFTTDANQTEVITVAYLSPTTKQWGCISLTITQTTIGPAATLSTPTPSGTLGTTTTATLGATTDQGNGTFYGVVDTAVNISGITAAQIKAGDNNGDSAAVGSGDTTISDPTPSVSITGLTDDTLYSYAEVQNNSNGDSNIVTGTFTTAVDTTPTLSAPSVVSVSSSSAQLSVSTDASGGTLYTSVTTSATPPSAADIKDGTGSVWFGNQAVSTTGVQN